MEILTYREMKYAAKTQQSTTIGRALSGQGTVTAGPLAQWTPSLAQQKANIQFFGTILRDFCAFFDNSKNGQQFTLNDQQFPLRSFLMIKGSKNSQAES